MEDRTYHDRSRRERSSERSREKRDRDRDRSREPRDVTPHYIEPVHVPIYYGVSKIFMNLINLIKSLCS